MTREVFCAVRTVRGVDEVAAAAISVPANNPAARQSEPASSHFFFIVSFISSIKLHSYAAAFRGDFPHYSTKPPDYQKQIFCLPNPWSF